MRLGRRATSTCSSDGAPSVGAPGRRRAGGQARGGAELLAPQAERGERGLVGEVEEAAGAAAAWFRCSIQCQGGDDEAVAGLPGDDRVADEALAAALDHVKDAAARSPLGVASPRRAAATAPRHPMVAGAATRRCAGLTWRRSTGCSRGAVAARRTSASGGRATASAPADSRCPRSASRRGTSPAAVSSSCEESVTVSGGCAGRISRRPARPRRPRTSGMSRPSSQITGS